MADQNGFLQDQAVLSHRVLTLEGKVDKIDATQDTIHMHVSRIADSIDRMAAESTRSRKETDRKLQCIVDTWDKHIAENGPILAELRDSRVERKALKQKAGLAVVGFVAVAVWQWGVDSAKWVFKIKTGS